MHLFVGQTLVLILVPFIIPLYVLLLLFLFVPDCRGVSMDGECWCESHAFGVIGSVACPRVGAIASRHWRGRLV
jgi:hypothetical protein